jgi:ATP/ADP translocase
MNKLLRAMKTGAIFTLILFGIIGLFILCVFLLWELHDHVVPAFISQPVWYCGIWALIVFVFATVFAWVVAD